MNISEEEKFSLAKTYFWSFLENFQSKGLGLLTTLILTNLILPREYAIVATTMIIISYFQLIVNGGLDSALVQKKEITERELSTVFYLIMLMACLLYAILFFANPLIADFYNMSELCIVLRVCGIALFFYAFNTMQWVVCSREFRFKTLFHCSFLAGILSAIVAVVLAVMGWGVWALVWQQLILSSVSCISAWIQVKWRPHLLFSFKSFIPLYVFGSRIFLPTFIYRLYSDGIPLIIGKFISPVTLSYYTQASRYPQDISRMIDTPIQHVVFPQVAKYQNEPEKIKYVVQKVLFFGSYISIPILTFIAADCLKTLHFQK